MIEVIPAIDIIDGKCVRLSQGDFETKKVYSESPLETAKQFESAGITRLHMVDLDGARQGRLINLASLSQVASNTNLKLDFGGGIKTKEDVLSVLNAGAGMINIGSIAVKQPTLVSAWIDEFGSDKILLGADVRDEKIVMHGWQVSTDIGIVE
ncbi:MAG TPA: HisA/HisF-related TIM barrel protein, partial [Parafilimonas sp.]|nr:HisA/HisF-related TIM barrel protein [Parafilimonas sp.]